MFESAIKKIFAIEFRENVVADRTIYLLFSDIDSLRKAATYLNKYSGTGFSLIINKIDSTFVSIKIYDIDTDDLFICEKVMTTPEIFERVDILSLSKRYISIGEIRKESGAIEIDLDYQMKVPLKSFEIK